MELLARIRLSLDTLFVPKDGLYDQAKQLIVDNDHDGNGRVDVSAVANGSVTPPPGLCGITTRGFAAADAVGNGDGQASVREVRAFLQTYDTGNGWDASAAGDKRIDGVELLRLLGELNVGTPGTRTGSRQAMRGAAQVA